MTSPSCDGHYETVCIDVEAYASSSFIMLYYARQKNCSIWAFLFPVRIFTVRSETARVLSTSLNWLRIFHGGDYLMWHRIAFGCVRTTLNFVFPPRTRLLGCRNLLQFCSKEREIEAWYDNRLFYATAAVVQPLSSTMSAVSVDSSMNGVKRD